MQEARGYCNLDVGAGNQEKEESCGESTVLEGNVSLAVPATEERSHQLPENTWVSPVGQPLKGKLPFPHLAHTTGVAGQRRPPALSLFSIDPSCRCRWRLQQQQRHGRSSTTLSGRSCFDLLARFCRLGVARLPSGGGRGKDTCVSGAGIFHYAERRACVAREFGANATTRERGWFFAYTTVAQANRS